METPKYSVFDNIRNALELAWKHKILWIFALMALGSSVSSMRGGNYSGSQTTDKKENIENVQLQLQENNTQSEELKNFIESNIEKENTPTSPFEEINDKSR